jgi:hypothetical protein
MGLLDRETGHLRWFAPGREESIAVTSIGPDGAIYIAHSPVRRAVARGLLGERLPPLIGGIQRYKPTRYDLFARDAVCAAAQLAQRWHATDAQHVDARRDDQAQTALLLRQARQAFDEAVQRHEIRPEQLETTAQLWGLAQTATSNRQTQTAAQSSLELCQALQ